MIPIIPKPNGPVCVKRTRFALPEQFAVDYGGFETWCVQAFYDRTGSKVTEGTPWLVLKKDRTLAREEYRLCAAAQGMTVYAGGEAGVVWALTSVIHLLDEQGTLPVCEISDCPRYGHRGLNLDCVRHFFSVETVKQVIEQISLAKLNVLHWHLTDDQAWRIESKVFPRLHESSIDFYTQEDIREVVEFARIRGIEVIPEIEMPGHTVGILSAYPQFGCREEAVELINCGGIFSKVLCAGKERTYEFLERLFDEICPLFPSPRFHIGGDEAPKTMWKDCPDCRKRMEDEGIQNTEDLQGYFTARVARMLQKHGKQIICWNDSLKAANLPDDTLIQYWTVQHVEQMNAYLATGKPFIYSDMYDLYLDYPHAMIPLKKVYTSKLRIGKQSCMNAAGLMGLEACLWTERIDNPKRLFTRLFPRIFAMAEAAWTHKRNYADFRKRLTVFMELQSKSGIIGTQSDWWDPEGEAGFRESMDYVHEMFPSAYADVQEQTADIIEINAAFMRALLAGFFKPADRPRVTQALTKSK